MTHIKSFRAFCRMQENDRIRIFSANFVKGGKPKKNPLSKMGNQQQAQPAPSLLS